MGKIHLPKWCLFFDFHTMPACPDVGKNFNPDEFTERIRKCGVDYIVFPAKCNLGMCYFNTRIGTKHPSLKYDMFGEIVKNCKKRGIAISAYINVGISHHDALFHREWCILTPEGYTYRPDRLNSFFRTMCYNTGYRDYILELIKEIVSNYSVDGLFLDCMRTPPCIGVECIREIKEKGIDWNNLEELEKFALFSQLRMAKLISETARRIKPNLLLYFNGIPYALQKNVGNYIEFECLPTGGWGYETLPVFSRYLRTLKKPVVNMTGRFHTSWGDFGGIRTEAAIEYDCLYGLANTMRITIGDHLHPRGEINNAVFDLIERVYKKLQKFEPWFENAESFTEIGVIIPQPGFKNYKNEKNRIIAKGIARILSELKLQFDILTEDSFWKEYKLLVLPDEVLLDNRIKNRVKIHLKNGGLIISTGYSGLDNEKKDFVIEEWNLKFKGELPFEPVYFVVTSEIGEKIPEMPLDTYENGIAVKPGKDVKTLGRFVSPYYTKHWDGEHGFVYLPPDKITEFPAIVMNDKVIHICFPLFTPYSNIAPVYLKNLLNNLIKKFLPDPVIKTSGLPSFARVFLTSQENRKIVHILSYVPERRGNIDIIEEPVEVRNIALNLRKDNLKIRSVYTAPNKKKLKFEIKENYIHTEIPSVKGYSIIVFEE